MEERPRRTVGSMDLGMTVVTGTPHDRVIVRTTGQSMTKPVALLAQPRTRDLQRELVDRAMGLMAVQAVHTNRLVLEQERSALLGMTLVAIVIDGRFAQQARIRGAVRLMAIGAGDLALTQRHV